MYDREYHAANREKINQKRREYYARQRCVRNEAKRAAYVLKRDEILKKQKKDRQNCPLCGLDFRRLYIQKHIATRHNKATRV